MNGLTKLETAIDRLKSGDKSAAWDAIDALATIVQASSIDLPYPPTANSFWQNRVVEVRGRKPFVQTYISKVGKQFKRSVQTHAGHHLTMTRGRAAVAIDFFPPDHRQRDIDNPIKPLLDALTDAGAWMNDDQVGLMLVRKCGVVGGGKTAVAISGVGNVQGGLF